MEKSSVTVNLGGFSMVLFIVFLVLKLTEVIDWSWWWVTSPLWVPVAFALILVGVIAVVGLLSVLIPTISVKSNGRKPNGRRR